MCGRFYFDGEFRNKLNVLMDSEGISFSDQTIDKAGKDVFPSNASIVIFYSSDGLTAANMHWGFTNPYKKGLIINARAETATEKKLFSDSIRNRRCIIPSSGFYEWDQYKARFKFSSPDEELILLAGFYHDENGVNRYTILTTKANDSMRPIHNRMPVLIGQSELQNWVKYNDSFSKYLMRPQQQLICKQDSGQIRMSL